MINSDMSSKYKEFLSKPELNFWIPIITSIVLITLSWANLTGEIKLLRQELLQYIEQNKALTQKYSDVQSRWGDTSQRVTVLETKAGLK